MKKLSKTIVTVAFAFTVSSICYSQFSGGKGTQLDPYKITSRIDMEALADSVANSSSNDPITNNNWSSGKYFKVINDIADSIKRVIVIDFSYYKAFQGNFNGNNKKITLAIVNMPYDFFPSALFGITYNANIYDLIVDGYVEGYSRCGSICGTTIKSNISGCTNYCNIITLSANQSAGGGICSDAYETNISNCVNYGNVVNGDMYIDGICGLTLNVKIINCKNYGNINGETCVGGIVGHTDAGTNISYCSNSGLITGNSYGVGGIVGHFKGDELSYSINIGIIIGKETTITEYPSAYAGGIVGMGGFESNYALVSLVYNCINSGLVVGKHIVGGIIGRCKGTVKNCINTGTVKGDTKTGCIVGENEGGTIENCHYDKQTCSGEK